MIRSRSVVREEYVPGSRHLFADFAQYLYEQGSKPQGSPEYLRLAVVYMDSRQ